MMEGTEYTEQVSIEYLEHGAPAPLHVFEEVVRQTAEYDLEVVEVLTEGRNPETFVDHYIAVVRDMKHDGYRNIYHLLEVLDETASNLPADGESQVYMEMIPQNAPMDRVSAFLWAYRFVAESVDDLIPIPTGALQ